MSTPMTPNVELIRKHATRIVRARIPAQVRKELIAAVKAGQLGHLRKDGLLPEVFFHPDHRNGAIDLRKRDAAYAIECIRGVIAHPLED